MSDMMIEKVISGSNALRELGIFLLLPTNLQIEIVDEWRKKVEDLSAELDATQRDNRNLSTDLFKARTSMDELNEYLEGVRRENKGLAQEVGISHWLLGEAFLFWKKERQARDVGEKRGR